MEARQETYRGPLPNAFKIALDAIEINYPGCENDWLVAREYLEGGLKANFLKAFRTLKGRQIAHEHICDSNDFNTDELDYPGNGADKQELQNWFSANAPNEKNVKIFQERIEGLRNKNTVFGGDRSHPNIVALLKLKLSYPGCEEDVQEALQVHYSRPVTIFPNTLHSLKAKQDLHRNDRSHWRLVKLDNLELTYPNWQEDCKAVEGWHINNQDNRENAAIFRDVIGGILEQEEYYLGWNHRRIGTQLDEEHSSSLDYSGSLTSGTRNNNFFDTDVEDNFEQENRELERKERCGGASFDRYLYMKEKQNQQISHFESSRSAGMVSEGYEEGRDPEIENERFFR